MLNISSEDDLDGNAMLDSNYDVSNDEVEIEDKPINGNMNITEKQLKFIHNLATERGIDKTSLRNLSKTMFGKDSSKNLTKQEASSLIETLQGIEVGD